jgi:MFS family permease
MCAAGFGIISLLLLFPIKETLPTQLRFNRKQLLIKWEDVVEPTVKPAATIMLLTAISSGVIFVLSPEYSAYLGITNKGYFFGIYVLTTIGVRLIFSSLSDRIGRRETMLFGCSLLVLSMIYLGLVDDIWSYTIAAAIFGLATGISSPTLFAWTADLSLAHRRGTGSGTLFIALELGILIGSGLTFVFYKNTMESARICMFIAAGFGVLALLLLLLQLHKSKLALNARGNA